MAENSGIEWTTHTHNPWHGCTEVSPACDNCYARVLAGRFGTGWGNGAERKFFGDKHWNEPLKWQRRAEKGITQDERHPRVFCASMADVFEDRLDLVPHRERLWRLIGDTPNLIWLLLTKRPHLMTRFAPPEWKDGWPDNVWPMTTVEDQIWANARIKWLMDVPARVRGVSMEPLFGNVILPQQFLDMGENAWIITGGESGNGARPGHVEWYRNLRDQATENGNTFNFKQWGNFVHSSNVTMETRVEINHDGKPFAWPDSTQSFNVGKHAAGRLLDGRTWDGVPPLTLTQVEHQKNT